MRSIPRLSCYLATLTFAALSVSAQPFPDAARLLAAQGDLLKTSSTVQYTSVMEMEMSIMGTPMKVPTTTLSQFAQPDRFRIESKGAGVSAMIMGYDGETTWMYMPPAKVFSRQKGLVDGQGILGQLTDQPGGAQEMSANAKVVRSEVLDIDGQPHDCWVVESKIDKITVKAAMGGGLTNSVYTWWIEKQSGLGVRTMMTGTMEGIPGTNATQMKMMTTLHDVKINLALPDSTFQFTPPSDAKEVPDMLAGMTSLISGATPGSSGRSGTGATTSTAIGGGRGIGPGSGAAQAGKPQPARAAVATPSAPASKFSPQAFVPQLHPTNRVEAKYPDQAKRDKVWGFVEILATVDPAGSVVETEVLEGKEVLRQAAIDAVKQWRFHPVLRNGQAVYAYTDIEVDVSNGEENNVPDNQSSDVFFTVESEFGTSSPMNRIFELMRTMPRTPQQELADLEQDLGDGSGPEPAWVLPRLAKAALKANALEKASNYANDMLKADTRTMDYGLLMHDGHTTRGLVALRQGNVALASQDLRDAGQTTGSPSLNAIGPNLTLASELLQKGERAVVLEYLERCKTFWKQGGDRLDAWIATIRSGGMPDLSGNFGF